MSRWLVGALGLAGLVALWIAWGILVPERVPIDLLLTVLRLLLEERVSIRNLPLILEAVSEATVPWASSRRRRRLRSGNSLTATWLWVALRPVTRAPRITSFTGSTTVLTGGMNRLTNSSVIAKRTLALR